MIEFLRWLWEFIFPRFVTDEVAFMHNGDDIDLICSMADVEPDEEFDGVVTVKCLSVFGMGLFGRILLDTIRPWGAK